MIFILCTIFAVGASDIESFEKREVNVALLMFKGIRDGPTSAQKGEYRCFFVSLYCKVNAEICHYNRSIAMKTLSMSSRGHEGQYSPTHPAAIFSLT